MIVADTGAIIALVDASDRHHERTRDLFDRYGREWVLPWAILPEVDQLLDTRVGVHAARAFRADVAVGAFLVEWGSRDQLERAHALCTAYESLDLGLVDAVVASVAEHLRARAIVTFDLRDFAPLRLRQEIALWPRDLAPE